MSRRLGGFAAVCLAMGCSYDPSGVQGTFGPVDDAARSDDADPLVKRDGGDPPEKDAEVPDAEVPDAEVPDAEVPDAAAPDAAACPVNDCHDPDCEQCDELEVCCEDGTCAAIGLCF